MRRPVRALSVVVVACGALAAIPVAASADPAAEVSPGSVQPGGSVTVTVRCDTLPGTAPASVDATSQAFADGTVRLSRVPGEEGAAYRGTARVAGPGEFVDIDGKGPDSAWTVDGTCPSPKGGPGRPWSTTFDIPRVGGAGPAPCPPPRAWQQPPPESARGDSCSAPSVQHGVQAGDGGTFTDSVPALAAGGLLIAGAFGAAAHRLLRRRSSADA